MGICASSVKPLIKHLARSSDAKQIWYADDSSAAGSLASVAKWWNGLCSHGPLLGYYPAPQKCHVLVKNQVTLRKAEQLFRNTGVNITLDGRPFLGGVIGTTEYTHDLIKSKVASWVSDIEEISKIALSEPHAAYYGFVNSISRRWQYTLRTVPNISSLLQPLENAIETVFIPALVGRSITPLERRIMSLPTRYGGLGICNPAEAAELEYEASKNITAVIQQAIKKSS